MSGRRCVRVELLIPAPRRAVWDVLVDFARYPEWNPFTVAVETRGRVGDPVRLDVRLGGRRLVMHERLRVFEPERRVGWGLRLLGGKLLDCTRVQALSDGPAGTTHYVCEEPFAGLAVPLFFGWTRAAMQAGFEANASALHRRVCELAASSAGAAWTRR